MDQSKLLCIRKFQSLTDLDRYHHLLTLKKAATFCPRSCRRQYRSRSGRGWRAISRNGMVKKIDDEPIKGSFKTSRIENFTECFQSHFLGNRRKSPSCLRLYYGRMIVFPVDSLQNVFDAARKRYLWLQRSLVGGADKIRRSSQHFLLFFPESKSQCSVSSSSSLLEGLFIDRTS